MQTEKANENAGIGAAINEFVQKNRKPIFAMAGLVVAALIGFIAALSIMDALKARAIAGVEELSGRYEALQPSIAEDYAEADVQELLADIEAFAKNKTGYAGSKAWSIAAVIHGGKGDWAAAESAWAAAAKAAKKTYLAPVAFFNAGAAAEEQGKAGEAIGYYSSSIEAGGFAFAPRAQFSIGRLRESLGEREEAITAYRALIADWSYDQIWTSLARDRIIALEAGEQ